MLVTKETTMAIFIWTDSDETLLDAINMVAIEQQPTAAIFEPKAEKALQSVPETQPDSVITGFIDNLVDVFSKELSDGFNDIQKKSSAAIISGNHVETFKAISKESEASAKALFEVINPF